MNDSFVVEKCGIKFSPASIVITYKGVERKERLRIRIVPVRNINSQSTARGIVENLKLSSSYKNLVEKIPIQQLENLIQMLIDSKKNIDKKEIISKARKMMEIDPNEDLNKVDEDVLIMKKALMNETYEKNLIKPGDENFKYDVVLQMESDQKLETHEWDESSDLDPF
ncbi:hypothetical protein HELRODRAFT_89579 [Helobdella robusta]|uniref:Centrosomal protein of 19 kDa n=1 Tax=Helobdella robusta TaxID=6412 RepID=T1G7E7_HELRO|nr:hypothetical protein HELRODRAFT_89579 [Helobdella robusta]ESN92367.1 hypothetical protein HELRODRAFT_89579 [Helobdella robusta]